MLCAVCFFENLALAVLPDTAVTVTFAPMDEFGERTYQASEPFDRIGRAGMCHIVGADYTESACPGVQKPRSHLLLIQ